MHSSSELSSVVSLVSETEFFPAGRNMYIYASFSATNVGLTSSTTSIGALPSVDTTESPTSCSDLKVWTTLGLTDRWGVKQIVAPSKTTLTSAIELNNSCC